MNEGAPLPEDPSIGFLGKSGDGIKNMYDIVSKKVIFEACSLKDSSAHDFTKQFTDKTTTSMTIEELIRSFGYPFEEFVYQTEDGYLNTVHRIPGTIRTVENAHEVWQGKPVVLY